MGLIKLLIPLVGSIAIGVTAMAADYKVGDAMPDFSKGRFVTETMWYNSDMSKIGKLVQYDLNNDDTADVAVANIDCKGYKVIFGFYDFDTDKLYLDNKPRDGKIDQVINGVEGRNIVDDAPACELGINT